jgi:predicted AAA+ superfamily ATPase
VGLYHLFKNPGIVQSNEEIQSILNEVKLENIPEISMVAIDSHNISSVKKGADARTLWGEIGKQLGCYDLVESFDKELKRPDASTLTKMINSTGKPVLIMIDELVNHLKDAKAEKVGDTNLAEVTVSFFHTMTDVIVNSKNAMFIVTLPGTESAYRKEAEMLEEYKKMVKELGSREASFTVPMEKSEIYEVIKKRLFEKIDETYTRQVAEELQQFYIQNSESFPDEVVQTSYYEKIKKSYPFHPALIDLLYERISTINEFQKTRGVLRLLSHVLRNVYNNVHVIPDDIIITPGIIDLNEDTIFQELTNKIARGEFQNVIKTDIVNDESEGKCQKLDSKDKFGSSIRIATSIYLHTLIGTTKEASIGCSQNELLLSTAVDKVTYPKDVLNEVITIENNLWYIYQKTGKWYFSVEVNINKVISDETDKVSKLEYDQEEIVGKVSNFC